MTVTDITTTLSARAVMRFAWYGRLSTKDKQDPTISFPSQREACERKTSELAGGSCAISGSPLHLGVKWGPEAPCGLVFAGLLGLVGSPRKLRAC
jgi:hypothetical protein